jgi:hypothetical protein
LFTVLIVAPPWLYVRNEAGDVEKSMVVRARAGAAEKSAAAAQAVENRRICNSLLIALRKKSDAPELSC